QALDRITKDKSVLVIAHRLSTIKNVNEIMVMDKGRIIEKGSHEKLMNEDSIYKQLFLKQFNTNADEQSA
ncbi:MAG: ABC transporter ATP-binding protein, partial [Bacillota bacterium]|nr:ABC transporter ATP-binding protein [Bacillota bacterium]